MKKVAKRVATTIATTGLLSGALAVAVAVPASASTIQNGYVQLCAQGSYSAYLQVNPVPVGSGGATTRGYGSPVESPGNCWWGPIDTDGQTVQVEVFGVTSTGASFYIGSESYNSSTGLGIGAEGSQSSPSLETW